MCPIFGQKFKYILTFDICQHIFENKYRKILKHLKIIYMILLESRFDSLQNTYFPMYHTMIIV